MNIERLKSAYSENPAVQAICDHLAGRNNNQNETKLHRIIGHLKSEAYEFKRAEIIAAFRKLEEADVGKYVEGRHGWPSRFVWEAKSLHIASHATDGLPPIQEPESEDEPSEEADFIEHTFVLRPDISISLELPSDLSSQEASRLAMFLKSLPFEADA